MYINCKKFPLVILNFGKSNYMDSQDLSKKKKKETTLPVLLTVPRSHLGLKLDLAGVALTNQVLQERSDPATQQPDRD